MTMSTAKIQKNLYNDGESDRILSLPKNVIDLIMEFLPMQDAIKTSILSSKWRYVWTDKPSIILDRQFWKPLKQQERSSLSNMYFVDVVNKILLHHIGNLEKIVLNITVIKPEQNSEIDVWLSGLSRRGVKELTLENIYFPHPLYRLPCCVFSNLKLTNLSLSKCIIRMTNGFSRLQSLSLLHITFDSCILITPLLTSLSLNHSLGIRNFSLSAPKLESLTLMHNKDGLSLTHYLICTKISIARIHSAYISEDRVDSERADILQLISCWPKLEQFELNGPAFKYLTKGINRESLKFMPSLTRIQLLWFLPQDIAWMVCILGHSPFLQMFEIEIGWYHEFSSYSNTKLKEYLEGPGIMMEQLHTIKLSNFSGSRNEVELVKFLLHCSPSLNRFLIEWNAMSYNYYKKKYEVLTELLSIPRAYPKTNIIMLK